MQHLRRAVGETARDEAPVTGLAARIGERARTRGLTFYESWTGHDDRQSRALLFYHCPKTGGMTVDYALSRALACVDALTRQNLFIGRLDDLKIPAGRKVGTPVAYVATHDPFGLHEKLAQPFDLVTLLREPAARVTSHFTYERMRASIRPEIEDFRRYYRAEENTNVMVRQLSGKTRGAKVEQDDLLRAIDNLDRHFAYFAPNDHAHELIGTFLSRFHAPNVLMADMNCTLPAYRIEAASETEEIRALNDLDVRLFELVRAQPRRLHIGPCDGEVSPMTVYVEEVEQARRSLHRPYHHRTERLPDLLQRPHEALRRQTWVS